jgi:Zn-dependent peptidase ImmA (M78 family)
MIDPSALSAPERLLWTQGVRAPEHIDLEAIAASRGARVVYRRLDGCAARLVASDQKAVISVALDDNPGRRRFSLGHELAHWICDASRASFKCANSDIGPQNAEAKTVEANANSFASQLLLPDYLVRPWLAARQVNMDLAQALSTDFRASLTASAIKLARRSTVPAVVACHDQSRVRWFQRNLAFPHDFYVRGQLHQDTAAFAMVFGAASGMSRPKREPADRWLNGPDAYRQTVSSQSVKLPDGTALSLITFV